MSDTAAALLALVNRQAEDKVLWPVAATAPEAYLQRELRRLHAAVEHYLAKPPPEEVARTLYEIDELGGTFAHNDCDPVKNGAAVAILENARNVLSRLSRAGQDAEAENARLREALDQCDDLFSAIRGDFTDPRSECRKGAEIIERALAKEPKP